MIQSSTAFTSPTGTDTSYKSWQTSMGKAVMRLDPSERTAGPIPTFGRMVHETALAAQGASHAYAPSSSKANGSTPDLAYATPKPDDGFDFGDVIDIINPLQHLPVIGTLYRKFTGDVMGSVSNIIGGAIFGGPIGAASSAINVAFKESTGKDVAENVLSLAGFDVSSEAVKKPEIVYEAAELPGTTLAVANLSSGVRNFGGTSSAGGSWNS